MKGKGVIPNRSGQVEQWRRPATHTLTHLDDVVVAVVVQAVDAEGQGAAVGAEEGGLRWGEGWG